MQVFQKEGFAGATTRKIAEQAGVNEVTLFRKFQTKENLFKLSVKSIGTQTLVLMEDIFTRDPSASMERQLLDVFQRLQEYLGDNMQVVLQLMNESSHGFPDVQQALLQIPQMLFTRLRAIFEASTGEDQALANPALLSFSFLGFTFYYTLMSKLSKGKLVNDMMQEFPAEYIHLILGHATSMVSMTDANEK